MDRRHFIVAAIAGTSAMAASAAPALAAEGMGLSDVQGALGGARSGEPVEMQRRGRGPGGGGRRGFRGGGRGFRGGRPGWRRRGFYGRPSYGRRYYGGPYYGGPSYGGPGFYRRCWINRYGRRVCRRPAVPFPLPVVPFF